MWSKFSIKVQLIVSISLFILIIQISTLLIINNLQKIDIKNSTINEINTLKMSLNTDLIKVIFTPNADSFSDITHRLKAFNNVNGLILYNSNGKLIFKYKDIKNLKNQKEDLLNQVSIFTQSNLLIKKNLIIDNYEAGFILIDITLDDYTKKQEKVFYSLLTTLPILFILAILLSTFLSKNYTRKQE